MAQRELINKDVAHLFEAIFCRMKGDDITKIMEQRDKVLYAAMNLGSSSQLEEQKKQYDVIENAVSNIIDYDMITIIKVLKESELIKVLDENN